MALVLLAATWNLLLIGAALGLPPVVSCGACAVLVSWLRPPGRRDGVSAAALLAFGSGFAALPAWLAALGLAGVALGLPEPPPAAPFPVPASRWIAGVAFAPLFEELLYRERLLPALRVRLGAPLALVASSAAFAAPHLGAWSTLTTFCVGLALGALQLATGRVGLCIAAHAGLNAAALACGLPPRRLALAPLPAALLSMGLLSFAGLWPRVRAARGGRAVTLAARACALHASAACRRAGLPPSSSSPSSSAATPSSPTQSAGRVSSTPS